MRYFLKSLVFVLTLFVIYSANAEDYKLFYDNGRVGLSDAAGKVIIPAKYEQLGWSNGMTAPKNNAIGYKSGDLWGILALSGEPITLNDYIKLYPAGESLYIASKEGKISHHDFLGVINGEGKTVLPFKYTSIELAGLRAIVGIKYGRQYQYGVVDLGGKMIIPMKYKDINPLGNLRFSVQNFENKTAIFNDIGIEVVDFLLDSISSFKNGHAIVYANHQRGVINPAGQIIAPTIYKEVNLESDAEVKLFDAWEIIGKHNLKDLRYDMLEPFGADKYRVTANGRQWLIDENQSAYTQLGNTYVGDVEHGKILFQNRNKWGVLSIDGLEILPAKFDSIIISKDVFYAKKDNLWSLYDVFGLKKSNQAYEEIRNKSGYYYPVKRRGYWGFIDRTGEEIIPCVYDHVGEFQNNKVTVKFHGEYGIIDKAGEWIVYPRKDKLKIINSELYLAWNSRLSTLKSFDDETIYFTENRIDIMEDHLLEHLSEGGLWKIDFKGRIVNRQIPNQKYDEIRASSDGLYAVKLNNRYGFIDNQNRLIIANRYENVGDFSEGLVAIKLLGRWGFIDKHENIVIQPVFEKVNPFTDGLAVVRGKEGYGLIDIKANRVSAFDYEEITSQSNGRFIVKRNGKVGLIDKNGALLINAKYDSLTDLGNGSVLVSLFGKFGVISEYGVDIVPINYDQIIYDARFNEYLAMKKSTWVKVTD